MTAARRPRSAALLVGSTSGMAAKVQSAGQSLSRLLASPRVRRCRLPFEPRSSSRCISPLIASTRSWRAARSPSSWNCFQAWKTYQVISRPSKPNASCGPSPRSAWKVKSRRRCEQRVQMLLAAAGRDPQQGGALPEGAPERAQLAGEIPAGLVDVERAGRTGLLEQRLVDRLQRLAGAAEDRVDRPRCNRAAKKLVEQLHQLAARETISDRQSGDRGLQRRQLRHLVTSGRTARLLLIRAEDVAAAAALRPVLDHLPHPLDRKQRPPMPNMARLAAPLSPRP